MKLIKAEVEFKVNGKPIKFTVIHNLPNLEDALDNWVNRTKKYTVKSFCNYVMDKHCNFVMMTEKQFKRISNYGIK